MTAVPELLPRPFCESVTEYIRHLQAEKAEWSGRRDLTYHDVFAALRQVSAAVTLAATIEWYRAVEAGRGLYDSAEECASQTGRALGIIEDE